MGFRRHDPKNAREFDGWLEANAVLGSILAIGILAIAIKTRREEFSDKTFSLFWGGAYVFRSPRSPVQVTK